MQISKARIKYIKSLELKKNRRIERRFVAEGIKLVGELMAISCPDILVATNRWIETHSNLLQDVKEVYEVSEDELRRISFLQHPQQVIAVFPMLFEGNDEIRYDSLSLALDGVQDPGNLGTIIRIADWFGIEQIFCSEDTADVWNPKVIQATMGSIARVRLTYCSLENLIQSLPDDYPVYGTLLDGNDITKADLENKGLLVMGNEGKGISESIAKLVTHRLLIPNYPQERTTVDSLNVAIATAIAVFALRNR